LSSSAHLFNVVVTKIENLSLQGVPPFTGR
jgi:hypothetical protein